MRRSVRSSTSARRSDPAVPSLNLLEHDAKVLAAVHGVPVPKGVLAESIDRVVAAALPPGPWMVKAQVPLGGRGKAGLIQPASTIEEVKAQIRAMSGASLRGQRVRGCRIESQVRDVTEAYLAMLIDPAAAAVRVLAAARGGIDIEAMHANDNAVRSVLCAPTLTAIAEAGDVLASAMPGPIATAMRSATWKLARLFLECEATLAEINPLFVRPDGSWLAGDLKLALDESAFPRLDAIRPLIEARKAAYPDVALKLATGFDYVEVDPHGTIGLLTTGAGLSMKLIDELRVKGARPFNFADVRSGQLRGDPSRLIQVLSWISRGPEVKVVLVNIFAGITHLGEFAQLLVQALEAVPGLKVPIVARLIGNGIAEARATLAREAERVMVEEDLAKAIDIVSSYA